MVSSMSSTNMVVRFFFPLAKQNKTMLEIPSTFFFRKINLSTYQDLIICSLQLGYFLLLYFSFSEQTKHTQFLGKNCIFSSDIKLEYFLGNSDC